MGFIIIIILQFVKISSRAVQEFIVHALITGFVSDQIQKWIYTVPKIGQLHYGMTNVMSKNDEHHLTRANYYDPTFRKAHVCDTKNLIVIGGPNEQRANIIPHNKLKEHFDKQGTNVISGNMNYPYVNIIDEYQMGYGSPINDRFQF